MFVVLINGIDASSHTQESDAVVQKARFESRGETNVTITEKSTFNPPVLEA